MQSTQGDKLNVIPLGNMQDIGYIGVKAQSHHALLLHELAGVQLTGPIITLPACELKSQMVVANVSNNALDST